MTTRTQFLTSMSRTWLMLWLVAMPLVHIHPEADHAHGTQQHRHGGLFHSVLSQDLSCEFHDHAPHSVSVAEMNSAGALHCQHSHGHRLNHDEIGFSFLNGSHHDISPHHGSPTFLLARTHSPSLIPGSVDRSRSSERSPPSRLVAFLNPIRPPPIYSA